LQTFLLPVDSSILHLPAVALSAASAFYMRTGNSVKIPDTLVEGLVRIFSENNEFMGVGELLVDGRLAPRRLVCA
jgi:tRNA pseudouridine55 synthase